MPWHHKIWNVLRPSRMDKDLEREMRFHLRERADDLEAEGLSASEAKLTARRRFGNFTRQVEDARDADTSHYLDAALRNLRYAARALWKAPAFTATVVLTLAIGMGANSSVFAAIYAVLLRPLPFPNSDQLVQIAQVHPRVPQPQVAPVRLEEWNRQNTTFQSISGHYLEDASELSAALPERLVRAFVAPRFLQTLDVVPALGRNFTPEEERFGGPPAVIISDRLWRRRFAADPQVIGKTLRFGRAGVPIVGVMPAEFSFPGREVDMWTPSPPDAPYAQNRHATWFIAIGRMKPNTTVEQARANLVVVQAALGRQYPQPDGEISVALQPLKDSTIGGVRSSFLVLYGSVTLLLLIACTNIAALLLSRAAGRSQEFAVRYSLGASRGAVIAQLLSEVLLLSLAGASLGLVFAFGAATAFRTLAKDFPRVEEVRLDGTIVLYSLACAIGVTLLCGIVPAWRGTRRSLSSSLAQGGRGSTSGRNRLQLILVGLQVAFAVCLLAGAGLLLRSLHELSRVSPGFNPERVLTFHLSSSWAETADQKGSHERVQRVLEGLRVLPGVLAASTAITLPGVPGKYRIELKASGRGESEPKIVSEGRLVSPDYFATMGIPLLSGEMCRDDPSRLDVMVNRTFANTFFNGETIIGRTLSRAIGPGMEIATVRGIVGDAREVGLDKEAPPATYLCAGPTEPGTHFLVRSAADPILLAASVRRKLAELEPRRSVYGLAPVSERISDAYSAGRLRTVLLSFFALTAIGLASVGLYGTLSYLVTVRRREVAVRLALGAFRSNIARQFLTQGLVVSMLGCAAGLALAVLSNRLLTGMLYAVTTVDTATLGGVIAVVLFVATAASAIPAIRASRLEPVKALRED